MYSKFPYSFGWIPDYPDIRDFTEVHERVKPLLEKIKTTKTPSSSSVDLRKWCSPIENQQNIGSCTAHAVAGVVEYFENRTFGKYIDTSRLFLYKNTRNLLHSTGDTGAFLKTALGALVLFGMPPEEYWPYDTKCFDNDPDAFCYAFGQNYKCISYFRHDPSTVSAKEVLLSIKKYLSSGIPSIFGFTVYQSIKLAEKGLIPFPSGNETILGGHAVAAVGFDDNIVIGNPSGKSTKGALLIRNSWGEEWGDKGYGWLPYEYILQGLALDFWSVLKQEWVDIGLFTSDK
jgi:C1A family cysteine protease